MANSKNIRPFIQKWEGGLSRNPNDTASSMPAPWAYNGVSGYHTNKGITYQTFSSLSPKLGYAATPENFFSMPNSVWDLIFKKAYWDQWNLDQVNSQAIADLLADFAWTTGINGSFESIKKYLATKNITVLNTAQAVQAINKISLGNEQKIFLELVTWRTNFVKSINQPSFITGWLNRLTALKTLGIETILKKKL